MSFRQQNLFNNPTLPAIGIDLAQAGLRMKYG